MGGGLRGCRRLSTSLLFLGSALGAAAGARAEAAEASLRGYVSPAYLWQKGGQNTFLISDSALYLEAKSELTEALIDLPYVSDSNSMGSTLVLDQGRLQAYLGRHYLNGYRWKLGRFERIYGYESIESARRPLSVPSSLMTLLPQTHTGLNLGYEMSDVLTWQFVLSNPGGQALSTQSALSALDAGIKLSSNLDGLRVDFGYLYTHPLNAPPESVVDIGAANRLGNLELKFETIYARPTGQDFNFGAGMQTVYVFNDHWSQQTRVEWSRTRSGTDEWQLTLGGEYQWNKNLSVRINYAYDDTFQPGLNNRTLNTLLGAGLFKF